MAKNVIITPTEPSNNSSEKKKKAKKGKSLFRIPKPKDTSFGSAVINVMDGSVLTRESVLKLIPFFLFLSAIGILYIANSYWGDKTVREIESIKKELKELRFEHISTKSTLIYNSQQSEVAHRLDSTGIKESVAPPSKIIVQPTEKE